MNDITPKEASKILSYYTNLGYGIVIEGDDVSKIVQALSLASKTLANGTSYNPTGDAISREALKEEFKKRCHAAETVDELSNAVDDLEDLIDNAPTVPPDMAQVLAYERGYHKAKEDVARRIKDQYNKHHELIPYWLSIGDTKGGAE